MKLLIINYIALPLPPVKGGAVEYLVDAFLQHNENTHQHQITVYSIYDQQAEQAAGNYKHTTFKYIHLDSLWDKLDRAARHLINRLPGVYIGNAYIAKLLRQEKDLDSYDAIIIENAPDFGLCFPRSVRKKLILHLHNDYLNLNTKLCRSVFDCFCQIYTISNTLGDLVRQIHPSDKVKTLYNGIDLDRFTVNDTSRRTVRAQYGIKDDDVVFMYCGRIVPDKGALELVRAFSRLNDPKCKLLIVGGSGYSQKGESPYMQQVIREADDRVIFTGFLEYSRMASIYNAADIGVIPSLCQDAFNLTTVEYMATQMPVIISDRGAMKELVDSRFSVIAPCDSCFEDNLLNAMQKMLDHKYALQKMGTAAQEHVRSFSIEAYCARFDELLNLFNGENYA